MNYHSVCQRVVISLERVVPGADSDEPATERAKRDTERELISALQNHIIVDIEIETVSVERRQFPMKGGMK